MIELELHELALGYLQEQLSLEEKTKVFQLIRENTEFLQLLSFELTLIRQFEQLKSTVPAAVKKRVYDNITMQNPKKATAERILHLVLQSTMPKIAWSLYQPCQRRMFAYE